MPETAIREEELLNYVYKNSQMGVYTIDKIRTMIGDGKFKKQLDTQYEEYRRIHDEAQKQLARHGCEEKGISGFDKIKSEVMIEFETMKDKSESKIAEMLMIGSNMGVINAVKKLKDYQGTDENARSLMEQLRDTEENNLKKLRDFL